jgi:hypothetical protein
VVQQVDPGPRPEGKSMRASQGQAGLHTPHALGPAPQGPVCTHMETSANRTGSQKQPQLHF